MSKLYTGSIDLSKIDKNRLYKHDDGRLFLDVVIWVNDQPDEEWKAVSIQQRTKKDEDKIYLGNASEFKREANPVRQDDVDDLPF